MGMLPQSNAMSSYQDIYKGRLKKIIIINNIIKRLMSLYQGYEVLILFIERFSMPEYLNKFTKRKKFRRKSEKEVIAT